jgi:hypothetical protein
MNIRTAALCVFLLAGALPSSARNNMDLVVLKNGDRLTCEIKSLNSGTLYVSLDYALGTISVDWSKVAHLESRRTFIVRTENGSVYRGRLNTTRNDANGPMNIEVIEAAGRKALLDQSRVIRMDQTSDAFWQRFNGTIKSGLTYSKGNQATQYNLAVETQYLRERWSVRMNFDSNLASSSGATTSTRNHLSFDGRHLLPRPHYFYGGLVSFLQSSEQGIRVQTLTGAGVGRFLKNSNRASIVSFRQGCVEPTRGTVRGKH